MFFFLLKDFDAECCAMHFIIDSNSFQVAYLLICVQIFSLC